MKKAVFALVLAGLFGISSTALSSSHMEKEQKEKHGTEQKKEKSTKEKKEQKSKENKEQGSTQSK